MIYRSLHVLGMLGLDNELALRAILNRSKACSVYGVHLLLSIVAVRPGTRERLS